ncbi:MAG: S24/S26 family peptidase [Clostridia bacterium]|nr:S24/S26 family peptidase [Clostridia bacterium]
MRDVVDLNELYPLIVEVIENGGEFRLYPRGTSMEPLIHAGDDSVMLGSAENIKNGDVLFYRRKNGAFVIHRLIEKRDNTFTMCGDHQKALEYGILPTQVIAKMVGYYKGDVYHSIDEPEYIKYTKKQLSRFHFYRKNPAIYNILRKIKHLFKKG